MKRKQLLEADRDNIWGAALAREKRRDLEGGRKPVDEVLWQAALCLEVCVIRGDLDEGTARIGGHLQEIAT